MSSALSQSSTANSGAFPLAGSMSALAGEFLSQIGFERQKAQTAEVFATEQQVAFSEVEQLGGVNTDQELQKLLLIEQSYAANAKIIQTVDEMIQSLLRI